VEEVVARVAKASSDGTAPASSFSEYNLDDEEQLKEKAKFDEMMKVSGREGRVAWAGRWVVKVYLGDEDAGGYGGWVLEEVGTSSSGSTTRSGCCSER
jgi:hypothetical protein